MSHKNNNIILLFTVALFFYQFTKTTGQKFPSDSSHNAKIATSFDPINDVLPLVHPFIISGSIEKIIEFLKAFPRETSYIVLKQIIQEKESLLNQNDKAQVIFGLAEAFDENTNIRGKIFNLLFILDNKSIAQWFVDAARNGYTDVIPAFIKWAHSQIKQHPELKNIKQKSLLRAIDTTDIKAFKNLIKSGIKLDKGLASKLLWYTVSNNKNSQFIPILAKNNADLWSTNKGHTLITKAVELNNISIVESLINTLKKQETTQEKIKKYINRFVNKEIGTPIQIALEKGYTKIELYLRKQGAVE